jgi:hypothetical protein
VDADGRRQHHIGVQCSEVYGLPVVDRFTKPDGKSRVETKGFVGSECREASRFVEQALGNHVNELLKPEFHQQVTSDEFLRHRS